MPHSKVAPSAHAHRASVRRACRHAAALLLFALFLPLVAHADACRFDAARARFEALLADTGLEGGALLIGSRDGILLEQYFGTHDANTVVPVASASKLLSAVRIAQLAEAGALDLEAPVSTHLPEFTGLKGTMTVGQMFSHTAGYGGDAGAPITLAPAITLAQAVDTIACCIAFPDGWTPGAQFAYGGISMHVGGRVAEVVGGGDWQAQWQRHVGAPLGITSIDYRAFDASTTNYGIGGSARASLRDYGRVLHMLLNRGWSNGARVLQPGSVEAIFTDRSSALPLGYAPENATPPVHYGLGNWLDPARAAQGRRARGHSLGLFGTYPVVDFEHEVFGIFMIKGPGGINDVALPVYEAMQLDIVAELEKQTCTPVEVFAGISGDGFEAPRVELGNR